MSATGLESVFHEDEFPITVVSGMSLDLLLLEFYVGDTFNSSDVAYKSGRVRGRSL
jgi:hypothetical protein